jgi:hypothetical protein
MLTSSKNTNNMYYIIDVLYGQDMYVLPIFNHFTTIRMCVHTFLGPPVCYNDVHHCHWS